MAKRSSRAARRANRGLVILSVLVIGSLALSAVISLVDPQVAVTTPTPEVAVTLLAAPTGSPTPDPTPTSQPPALPAPTIGPALAPTPSGP